MISEQNMRENNNVNKQLNSLTKNKPPNKPPIFKSVVCFFNYHTKIFGNFIAKSLINKLNNGILFRRIQKGNNAQNMKNSHIKKAAIMGGTFDPIHYGHLLAAERVREEFDLDRIFFIPTGNPPHKSYKNRACADDRYKMTAYAVDSNPYFELLDIEVKREGYSYTIDTVNQLKELLSTDYNLYFIVGADNAGDILNWKRAGELLKEIEFIIVTRPGKWEESFNDDITKIRELGGKVNVLEIPLIPIKSTEIRERIINGKSIRYIVPREVEDYINENGLYKNSEGVYCI